MADSIIGKISVGDGATFTPDVTDGVLSFTNNKNLPNPEPYNIAAKVLDEGENELRTLVTAAETAAGNAATSETNAHNSEQAAKASETAAATSASAAKTSETNAASSETAAATSATNAATSETNASNSASAAATSESNASDSATAAAASAAEVEAALDDYLPLSGGTLTGDVDITGDLSVSGAIYSSDPASGENSGQVPTTAWVQKLLADALKKAKLDAHPVGSYYWSNDSTSPATLFGGTWEALPPGYTLIAQGSGSDSFGSYTYTAGQKYGERKHKLTTDELAIHSHNSTLDDSLASDTDPYTDAFYQATHWTNHYRLINNNIRPKGGDQPHNNLQPSVAAYCWKRTA